MSKVTIINDIVQMFEDLPYEDKLMYRYGYISSKEMTEDLMFELEECDEQDAISIAQDMQRLLQKGKNE